MNNKFTNSLLILAVGGLMLAGSASAQTSTTTSGAGPGVVDPGHPRVNEVNRREENQQQHSDRQQRNQCGMATHGA